MLSFASNVVVAVDTWRHHNALSDLITNYSVRGCRIYFVHCCQVDVLNLMMIIEYKVTENVIIRYDDWLSICDCTCSIAVSCTVFEIFNVDEFHPNLCTIAEIYGPGAIFFLLIVWVYLHSLIHKERRKNLHTVKVLSKLLLIESPYVIVFYYYSPPL